MSPTGGSSAGFDSIGDQHLPGGNESGRGAAGNRCAGAVGMAPKFQERQDPFARADTEFLLELHAAISTLRTRWRSTALAWCRHDRIRHTRSGTTNLSDYLANAAAAIAVVGHEALVRT
jgi:hypothetical protein